MIGVPFESLREINSIEAMLEMLKLNRLDAISFDRASVMTVIHKQKIEGIYYQLHPNEVVRTSLMVQNTPVGKILKEKLDALIKRLDYERIFAQYLQYINLPDKGIVSLK